MGFLGSVAGPIIQGVTGLAGSALASRGAGKAAEASERSAAQALAFEREREMRRRQEYDEDRRLQREQHEAEQRRLAPYRQAAASVLAKYGIQIPMEQEAPPEVSAGMPSPPGAPPGGPPPQAGMFGPGMTLGQLGSRRPYGY